MAIAGLTVGVVVPTHNRKELLVRTLESLEKQARTPDAVVVVADGCSDGTEDLLRSRGGVAVLTTPGLGAAGARNAGWRSLDVDVVAFIDDDCVAEPGWLQALASGFDTGEVALVQGRTLPDGDPGPYDRTLQVLTETGLYESCNIAYRRDVLEQVGGMRVEFAERFGGRPFGEDTDLAWRVLGAGWRSAFVDEAVVRHAVFPGTLGSMVKECWRAGQFPFLAREIPELSQKLPGRPWIFRRQSLLSQLALVGTAAGLVGLAARRRPFTFLLALPYLAWVARQTRQPARAGRIVVRDSVTSVALVVGSIRHRRLLL